MTTCPICHSPDLIPYWNIRENAESLKHGGVIAQLMHEHYPNAMYCVDCDRTFHEPLRERARLAGLRKAGK